MVLLSILGMVTSVSGISWLLGALVHRCHSCVLLGWRCLNIMQLGVGLVFAILLGTGIVVRPPARVQHPCCYTPWTILLSCTVLYLYSLTMCTTRPFLPDYDFLYWTYVLSRYLAATLCSLTFLIRITFACHHCLIPWLTSILYLVHVSHFCSNTYDLFCCLLYIWLHICQHITVLPCWLITLTRPLTLQWLLL